MEGTELIAQLAGPSDSKALPLTFKDIKERKIHAATCKLYGYGFARSGGEVCQVANFRNKKGALAGQHIRTRLKTFTWNTSLNTKPSTMLLFGQHMGDSGTLILTEGQIDAMSCYEVLSRRNPFSGDQRQFVVASAGSVSDAKSCVKAQLAWVLGFDQVIVFLDLDEPGRKVAAELAELIGPATKIVQSFAFKDANEALVDDADDAIRDALISATKNVPQSIVHAPDLLTKILSPTQLVGLSLPWKGWNDYTHGFKPGELWLLSGGTSIGKSLFSRSIALDLTCRGHRCAYVGLEESCEVTAERMLTELLMSDRPLYLDTPAERAARDHVKLATAYNRFAPNLWLLDEFGGDDFSSFVNVVKHYVLSEKAEVVFLDHFSMLADGISLATDQRRAIDKCIKELKRLAVNLKFTMFVVCHLSREGMGKRTPEEGGEPHLGMLRGSQSLAQIPDYIVMLQRNPNAESDVEKNTTYCHLKKNRPTGKLGMMAKLHWLPSHVFHEVN